MVLAILLQIILFIASPMGMAVLGAGIVLFLALPIVPRGFGVWKSLRRFHLWLAMSTAGRAAVVVSEHGDLLFKQMSFDDTGVEQISFGSDTKEFEDPATRLHYLAGVPFALADEVRGVLFDPRDAAVGGRRQSFVERGIDTIRASDGDYDAYGIDIWVPGVFELPRAHELVDLSKVRHLVDGGERAEYPDRMETLYKHSRDPYDNTRPMLRLLVPVGAFVGVLILMWQLADQTSGPNSTIGYGALLLISLQPVRDKIAEVVHRIKVFFKKLGRLTLAAILASVLPLGFMAVLVFTNPLFAIVVFVTFVLGFLLLPMLAFLSRPFNKFSGALASLFLKTALMGWDKPVIEWTPRKYRIREDADIDSADGGDVKWYSLAGSLVGFTYQPSPESWGAEVVDHDDITNQSEVATDGGTDTNIPKGYVRSPGMQRGPYGGYVPRSLDDDSYYIHSGIAVGRWTDSAVGRKSLRRLLQAKDEHGEGALGLGDRTILWATMGSMVMSALLGVFLFFL